MSWNLFSSVIFLISGLLIHFSFKRLLGNSKLIVPKKILLVTAHPDDECLFFFPLINEIVRQGGQVDLLCLSSGNHDGLGQIRQAELKRSCGVLKITNCQVINDP